MATPSYQAPPPPPPQYGAAQPVVPVRKLSFGEKVKGFLGSPTNTFNSVKSDTLGDGVKYCVILLVILGILSAIVTMARVGAALAPLMGVLGGGQGALLGAGVGAVVGVILLISIIIGGIIALFIGGAWLHLWVWIFGGRKGYGNTVKALAYGSTPSLLLSWIPFIGLIFGIWALILEIIGVRQLHEISTGRAVGAVLVALIIPMIIASLVLFV